jgi:hypothetical protein
MENCKKATPLIAFGLALLLACQQDELPPSVDQVDYEAIGLEHN